MRGHNMYFSLVELCAVELLQMSQIRHEVIGANKREGQFHQLFMSSTLMCVCKTPQLFYDTVHLLQTSAFGGLRPR